MAGRQYPTLVPTVAQNPLLVADRLADIESAASDLDDTVTTLSGTVSDLSDDLDALDLRVVDLETP